MFRKGPGEDPGRREETSTTKSEKLKTVKARKKNPAEVEPSPLYKMEINFGVESRGSDDKPPTSGVPSSSSKDGKVEKVAPSQLPEEPDITASQWKTLSSQPNPTNPRMNDWQEMSEAQSKPWLYRPLDKKSSDEPDKVHTSKAVFDLSGNPSSRTEYYFDLPSVVMGDANFVRHRVKEALSEMDDIRAYPAMYGRQDSLVGRLNRSSYIFIDTLTSLLTHLLSNFFPLSPTEKIIQE